MCTLTKQDSRQVHAGLKRLAQMFMLDVGDFTVPDLPPIVNVFAVLDTIPVWTHAGATLGIWPFVPKFVSSLDQARLEGQGAKTANCRVEEALEKPTWKEPILVGRCIVPVSSYVEHQHRQLVGKRGGIKEIKVPYRFHRPDEECLMLAAVGTVWRDGKWTFAICTREPDLLNRRIHNSKPREPVALRDDDEVKLWMGPGDVNAITGLFLPREDGFLVAEETEGINGKRVENAPPEPPFNPPTQGLLF